MRFLDFLRYRGYIKYLNDKFIIESFDSSLDIVKVQKGNPDFYYVEIDKNQFRIFIEKADRDLCVGFEYFDPKKGFVTSNVYDILDTKEILSLFGTILKILKTYKVNSVMFCSDESKKFRVYLKLMTKLDKELNFKYTSHDDKCIYGFNSEYRPKIKFKYKEKK